MRNAGINEAIDEVHDGKGRRIAIVYTRWNDEIISEMYQGACSTLLEQGVAETDLETIIVPGAYELPLACKLAAETGKYDAVIAIGCVIRGDTPHFDYVAGEAARGLTDAAMATNVPVIFGVLTVNNYDQAWQRADRKQDNKGAEFALAALEMTHVKEQLKRD